MISLFYSIFDGSYGSNEENALEIKLDLLESQRDTIQVGIQIKCPQVNKRNFQDAQFRWSQAAVLVECGNQQVKGL